MFLAIWTSEEEPRKKQNAACFTIVPYMYKYFNCGGVSKFDDLGTGHLSRYSSF